jgi:Na+/phosphate symporter
MVLVIPLAFALAGLVVYVLASNPKAAEIGRIMLWVGLLVTLLHLGGQTVSLLK